MALEVGDKQALQRIGANVRAERSRRGWSQEELGRTTKLGQQAISEMELAKVASSVTAYVRIAISLEIPISRIFIDIDDLDAS